MTDRKFTPPTQDELPKQYRKRDGRVIEVVGFSACGNFLMGKNSVLCRKVDGAYYGINRRDFRDLYDLDAPHPLDDVLGVTALRERVAELEALINDVYEEQTTDHLKLLAEHGKLKAMSAEPPKAKPLEWEDMDNHEITTKCGGYTLTCEGSHRRNYWRLLRSSLDRQYVGHFANLDEAKAYAESDHQNYYTCLWVGE